MVRDSQPWNLSEPRLNEHGQPIAQHIAQILGCLPPNSNIDLPVKSIFPEDKDSIEELYRELEEHERSGAASTPSLTKERELACDGAAISEPQDSDVQPPYCLVDLDTQGTVYLPLQARSDESNFEGAAPANLYGTALDPDTPLSPCTWSDYNAGYSDLTMCLLQRAGVMQGNLESGLNGVEPFMRSDNLGIKYRNR